jgi:hypothetical protein
MLFKKFKTNRALWLGVSAIVFLLIILFGHESSMNLYGSFEPTGRSPELPTWAKGFWTLIRSGAPLDGILFVGLSISLMLGVPALILGWFIHCVILVICEYVKTR